MRIADLKSKIRNLKLIMATKDYYKILGVAKNASKDEIKKAYRKLAMQYHPDKTKGDKVREEKFKEISEAYAVLSNDEKRKQFDSFGADGFHQRYSQEDIFRGSDLGDVFADLFKGSRFSSESILDQIFGGGFGRRGFGGRTGRGFPGAPMGYGDFASSEFGRSGNKGTAGGGQDLAMDLEISLRDSFFGQEQRISYRADKLEEVTVKIPKGIDTGQKLRLAGKGIKGGDLYITAKVGADPVFQREGNNLTVDREISLTDAVLGATIEVHTLEGSKSIKIPPLTQSHTRIRIKGQGMPLFKENGRGDLYVRVLVRLPKKLTKAQEKLFQELQREGL